MFGKNLVVGRRLTKLTQASTGDCYLQLDDELWVQAEDTALKIVTGPLPPMNPAETLGEPVSSYLGHAVRQVVVSGLNDAILIVLRHGLHLEIDRELTGGKRWYLGRFADWSDEDKDEPFVDYWDRTPAMPWRDY